MAGLSLLLTALLKALLLRSLAMPSSKASLNIFASPVRIVSGSGTGVQLESVLVGEGVSDPGHQYTIHIR